MKLSSMENTTSLDKEEYMEINNKESSRLEKHTKEKKQEKISRD